MDIHWTSHHYFGAKWMHLCSLDVLEPLPEPHPQLKNNHEITQLQSETATTCFPIQARGFENNWHGDPRTPIDSVSAPVCGRLMQHSFPWVRHQEVVFHLTFLGSSKMSSRSSFSHIFVMSPKRQDESCPSHFPSISCFTFSFSTWYSKTKR